MNFARHTLELTDGRIASATAAQSPPRAFAGTSLAVSLMFHSAVAMAAIAWRSTSDTGAVPQPSDAISIEMVATDVTDAREDTVERRAAAASSASAAAAVSEVQPDQTVDTVEAQTVEASEPAVAVATDVAPVSDADDLAVVVGAGEPVAARAAPEQPQTRNDDTKQNAPPRKPVQREHVERKAAKPPQVTHQKPTAAKPVVSRAAQSGSTGRVSASRGDVLSYAARVRSRVASRKPAGNGARGTVVISFSVTRSGGLGGARISSSSGSGALDRAALSAVRGAGPFPPPPGGSGSLSFSVPFHYK